MNKENKEMLQETLKYLGFGENALLNEEFEQSISDDPPEFQLFTEVFYEESYKLEAALHFRKSEKSGWYFFNHYEALLRTDGEPDKDRRQIFYISRGNGVTLKEAYNLLQGRSVYKKKLTDREGNEYDAWIQLNFQEKNSYNNNYIVQQFAAGYGYDLEKVLSQYPIRELKFSDLRVTLVRSLQRGNLHTVNFEKPRGIEKMYIAANPQYKTIYLYSKPLITMQRTGVRSDLAPIDDLASGISEATGENNQQDDLGAKGESTLKEGVAKEETSDPDKKTGLDSGSEKSGEKSGEETSPGQLKEEGEEDEKNEDGPEEKAPFRAQMRPPRRPVPVAKGSIIARRPTIGKEVRKGERKLS